ncbi:Uncharacterised protein [Vibrio cholerae]|uniref:Uncharacterized protein n=1 Tax=Vibrio cholerae TaxID=666 RepID=A0A655TMZ6_VIBCL|nr:Uncharacterised protein [Vibrio cholerae]CSA56514.1 Uncharacterised protein [Vibrio cholerae]CSB37752.1 Uncharacterised protein [Vibrio cholerae]CSB41402.1 Uncharacterised protein [Vibrio cholerae]CSB53847.1 Uncharacterised protein [Vibrio cholerae]
MYAGLLPTGLSIPFRSANGVSIIEATLYFGLFSSSFNADSSLGNALYSWVLSSNVRSRRCIGSRLLVIFSKTMTASLMSLKYFTSISLSAARHVLV